jgi:hypothetical protein
MRAVDKAHLLLRNIQRLAVGVLDAADQLMNDQPGDNTIRRLFTHNHIGKQAGDVFVAAGGSIGFQKAVKAIGRYGEGVPWR